MSQDSKSTLTRRAAMATGLAGVTAAALPSLLGSDAEAQADGKKPAPTAGRMPAVYLPHGGGPWPFVEMGLPKRDVDSLAGYLRGLGSLTPARPKALLVISAHWEEERPTLMTAARPPILYDYYGFPRDSYAITWPAPGDPKLAARVAELLAGAGVETRMDGERGFDHGTFVPLKLTYPEAEIPTVQLSMLKSLDPAAHLRLGRALAPLRDEGVFIVGSGMSFHNMRMFRDPRGAEISETFDAWLQQAATQPAAERDRRLASWASAPAARAAHPREEHLLPLMVVAGAAGEDVGRVAYSDTFMGTRISAFHFG